MTCPNKAQPGGCPLHNLQCGYPDCDKPAKGEMATPDTDALVRDLVERLRAGSGGGKHWQTLETEAADTIERLTRENAALKTVMVAAAEEIQAHWEAHCDKEGYGPANLMRRLEEGIPAEYGYTAGAFAELIRERDDYKARFDTDALVPVGEIRRVHAVGRVRSIGHNEAVLYAVDELTPGTKLYGPDTIERLTRERERCAWQPIKTAPRDEELLVGKWVRGEWRTCQSGHYFDSGCEREGEPSHWFWSSDWDGSGVTDDDGPTHWMPLTAPPPEPAHEDCGEAGHGEGGAGTRRA